MMMNRKDFILSLFPSKLHKCFRVIIVGTFDLFNSQENPDMIHVKSVVTKDF